MCNDCVIIKKKLKGSVLIFYSSYQKCSYPFQNLKWCKWPIISFVNSFGTKEVLENDQNSVPDIRIRLETLKC